MEVRDGKERTRDKRLKKGEEEVGVRVVLTGSS